jgi:hypothetical protein
VASVCSDIHAWILVQSVSPVVVAAVSSPCFTIIVLCVLVLMDCISSGFCGRRHSNHKIIDNTIN